MKKVLILAVFFGFGMASCAQYTCPTYTKKDVKQEKELKVKNNDKEALV
ncbi:hypothetical protein [Aureibacter tunicatorum]|uniref:Lipoprotein n=1 Tax=Aureibacter tunicatorum TaxID=866807 RepID=A0AAE3XNU9_9BACT|nr:hypothetical protein [Aureibacter tunicatorum]MDR6240362.1 hypothetical protein [Aureibacter tunicatorum]BDD05757.1 hypothetical protein AUTU_32400 [Aureibacter tunicatorum]